MDVKPSVGYKLEEYVHTEEEKEYRAKPLYERTWNVVRMIFNSALFYISMIPQFLPTSKNYGHNPSLENTWTQDNRGLFVVIHGLYGTPQVDAFLYGGQVEKAVFYTYEVRAPFVPDVGNCPLEKAAAPILSMVRDYIEKNPGKPVHLIGHSNGGRIAAYVETQLRDVAVDIRVTAVAGVFFGTSHMTQLSTVGMVPSFLDKTIVEDFQEGSQASIELITHMKEPITKGTRSYEFYASANDLHIPNFSSCFPLVNQDSSPEYHLVTGQDHASLLSAVSPEVIKNSRQWMSEKTSITV